MPRKKNFSARDVDQLIPLLEKIFGHLESCRSRAEQLSASLLRESASEPVTDIALTQMTRSQVQFLLQAVEDDLRHIQALGGVTKDLEAGLVDFPGTVDGEAVWLCWKRGETKLRFWHSLDQGFRDRQALQRPGSNVMSH